MTDRFQILLDAVGNLPRIPDDDEGLSVLPRGLCTTARVTFEADENGVVMVFVGAWRGGMLAPEDEGHIDLVGYWYMENEEIMRPAIGTLTYCSHADKWVALLMPARELQEVLDPAVSEQPGDTVASVVVETVEPHVDFLAREHAALQLLREEVRERYPAEILKKLQEMGAAPEDKELN